MMWKAMTVATAMAMMLASSARARRSAHEEVTIGHCIRQAAGGKPWLEKTLWGLRDQEAGWIGAEVANSNGTHDLGPLQINSWWVGKIAQRLRQPPQNVRQWLRYDACFNAAAARWIFLSGISVTHDYWKAIGVYHSPTEWRQTQYAASVANHLRRRYGLGIFRPPEVPH